MFFYNDTATSEIYTLSLHDALPIWRVVDGQGRPDPVPAGGGDDRPRRGRPPRALPGAGRALRRGGRLGRDTSELPSHQYLVCHLLSEKIYSGIANKANTNF